MLLLLFAFVWSLILEILLITMREILRVYGYYCCLNLVCVCVCLGDYFMHLFIVDLIGKEEGEKSVNIFTGHRLYSTIFVFNCLFSFGLI